MNESAHERRRAVNQLQLFVLVMALGYACIRTLRFTNDGFNLAFVCAFFILPFLAIRPAMRLRRCPKAVTILFLSPVLALCLFFLLATVTCDIPAAVEHRELSSELSSIQFGASSVHLLWEETAGGAVGPHGVVLEQRRFLVPGLYVMKHLDYFEGAHEGKLTAEGADKVRLHIPKSEVRPEVDRVYSLKEKVFF